MMQIRLFEEPAPAPVVPAAEPVHEQRRIGIMEYWAWYPDVRRGRVFTRREIIKNQSDPMMEPYARRRCASALFRLRNRLTPAAGSRS